MMIKEFLQKKQGEERNKKMKLWMQEAEHPELSLGPSRFSLLESANSSSSESEVYPRRKRKYACDDQSNIDPTIQTSIELQHKDPLPLDWEQCLDLESGRMYYLNRKTLKKSWHWPEDRKIDLELNISTHSYSDEKSSTETGDPQKGYNANSNMVAVACLKCHLLVMLCKSSPSCPNCKYLHSLPTQQLQTPKIDSAKTLETLSLLN
ncbi:hypothetical protein ACLOJK_011953 [Asimina triloba]